MTTHRPHLCVTYVRTSTVLLTVGELHILTDPWFSMRMRFLPALVRPGMALSAIPSPHLILCSHLHADHFEPAAIRKMAGPHTVVVGPAGTATHLPQLVGGLVHEMQPYQQISLHAVKIASFPMRHTYPPPEELGFLLEVAGWRILFAGDAADSPVFEEIAATGPIDLAILPVGGSLILGRRTVMNPRQALHAAARLGAQALLPVHRGGDWLPMPPLSIHPGTLRKVLRLLPDSAFQGRLLPLHPGQSASLDPAANGSDPADDACEPATKTKDRPPSP